MMVSISFRTSYFKQSHFSISQPDPVKRHVRDLLYTTFTIFNHKGLFLWVTIQIEPLHIEYFLLIPCTLNIAVLLPPQLMPMVLALPFVYHRHLHLITIAITTTITITITNNFTITTTTTITLHPRRYYTIHSCEGDNPIFVRM